MEKSRENIDSVFPRSHASELDCSTSGVLAIYTGFMSTHPGVFAIYVIWDSIHSHHKMEHSPAYGPFVQAVIPFIAGEIEISHFEITDREQLKIALDMPVTQISHLPIHKDKVADFLKGYGDGITKYIAGHNYRGISLLYPYEDPYVLR